MILILTAIISSLIIWISNIEKERYEKVKKYAIIILGILNILVGTLEKILSSDKQKKQEVVIYETNRKCDSIYSGYNKLEENIKNVYTALSKEHLRYDSVNKVVLPVNSTFQNSNIQIKGGVNQIGNGNTQNN